MLFSNNKAKLCKIILGVCSLPIILLSASTATQTIDYAFPKLKIEAWPHSMYFYKQAAGQKFLVDTAVVLVVITIIAINNHCR